MRLLGALLLGLAAPSAAQPAAPLDARAYVGAALAASPEVRQAREAYKAADAEWKGRLAATYLPTLSVTGQTYLYGDDPSQNYRYHGWRLSRRETLVNTTANWNLFNGFQDWLKLRSAGRARAAARASLDAARQERAYAAYAAYYELGSRATLLEVAREDLKAQREQHRQTRELYRAGLKSLADLLKSETETASSELRLAAAESDYKGALAPYNELLARPLWTEAALAGGLTPGATELPPLAEDELRLAARRPDLARAEEELEKSRVAERQAVLGLLPTVSVNAAWNRTESSSVEGLPASNFGIPNPHRWVGMTVSLPVGFNLFTQGYGYAGARAERRRAEAAAEEAARTARRELYAAWIALEKALRSWEIAARKEDIARRSLEIVEAQYRQGSADALRMAQARNDLLSARVERATALYGIFTDRARYLRAAGVPLWQD